jgi:hypothetical protein
MQHAHQHAHATCTCNMHMQHAHATCTCNMHMQHAHATCTCTCNMQHAHQHAHATCTCNMHMHMQHAHAHATCTCTCNMHMHMQHAHAHATCTCTCNLQWVGALLRSRDAKEGSIEALAAVDEATATHGVAARVTADCAPARAVAAARRRAVCVLCVVPSRARPRVGDRVAARGPQHGQRAVRRARASTEAARRADQCHTDGGGGEGRRH